MRRLIPRLSLPEPVEREHGSIVALVSVMLGTGVLLGMCALVIDIGLLQFEKEQLQSGADAASWKVAQSCVNTPANCTNALQQANAQLYANRNSRDTVSTVQVCIGGQTCPTWSTPAQCKTAPYTTGTSYKYVEVRTSTFTPDNRTTIPPVFAGAIPGINYTGTRMGACARVAWGVPQVTTSSALSISKCDYDRMTTNGTVFQGLGALDPLLQQTGVYGLLGLSSPTDDTIAIANPPLGTCPANIAFQKGWTFLNGPGNTLPDANCKIYNVAASTPTTNYYYSSSSTLLWGATTTSSCLAMLDSSKNGQVILVPIWDQVLGLTNLLSSTFRVVGFAPFVVTGRATLLGTVTPLPNLIPVLQQATCLLQTCIYGHFTKSLIPQPMPTAFADTQNFGATVIGRTG
ncbi:Tad domain-containing protein [Actinoplanes sp. NPDC051851]|uniref:Tad domain-containing protein n=1 Tax=Actinoplanes sp. NPDC051851 TaxID=3154753 RepID=UPI0034148811